MSFMELLALSLTLPSVLLASALVLVVAAAAILQKGKPTTRGGPLPPGPWRIPILGNIHNLAGSEVPHQRLAELSSKHGPLMFLQLGQIPTVVVSSPDVARAFLKTHDIHFADRPAIMAAREMAYNCRDMAFAPYGDYWRTMKKIAVVELLTTKRVASLSHIRRTAVSMILKEVVRAGSEPVNLSRIFYISGSWIASRAAFGNTESEHQLDYVSKIMNEMVALAAGMNLADFFPTFESLIEVVTGTKRKMRELFLKMDGLLENIVKEQMSGFETSKNGDEQKDEDHDLLGLLLKHYRLQDLDFPISVYDIKGVVTDMFFGGTDTSSSTLEWAMAEMIKNPSVMHKAQSEVRTIVQEKGNIDDRIIYELNYIKLVVKETLRLHPPLPLLVPRECRDTCEICNYLIPAKTRVLINAWALGRDPDSWERSNEFDPERFRDQSLDFTGTDFRYLPFGAGRRMCPGATFGIANIDITLAKLLYHFDWKLPNGMSLEDLNMEETSGATIHKKVPLCLVASPRVPI